MTYKDPFTLDGAVRPQPGVTKTKVEAMSRLLEKSMRGDYQAVGTLKEALSTSDAIFNFAHAVNLNFVPNFADLPREWRKIAGTRGASDFRPVALYTLGRKWADGALGKNDPAHVSPIVPEGTPYPLAYMAGEEIEGGKLVKRGFTTDFTFEAFLNDTVGFLRALPENMRTVALDTEEFEVFTAFKAALTAANKLTAGTNPDGSTVAADAGLSRASLIQALAQLGTRKHDGRLIPSNGRYVLAVAPGQRLYADFIINNISLVEKKEGSDLTLSVSGYNPLAAIEVIESEYFAGKEWALTPAGGSVGPRPVLDRLHLIGHEVPEIRVSNFTGSYVGGGAVSPFEGSFTNDSATFRLRQFGGAVAWTPQAMIWSKGDK